GAGRRGRGAGILERAARGVPGDPRAALLVPQDIECSCRAAEVGAPGGEEGARRDLERRGQVPRPRRGQGVRVDLWCEVSEGGRQDQRRRRAAAGVLRLPGRALDSSENYKSDRIYLRHRAEPEQDHQGPRLPRRRNRHGLQADRGGPVTLAGGQRAPSCGARPRRREVRERQTRRTARRHHRYRGGRIKDLDPQVLTIAPRFGNTSISGRWRLVAFLALVGDPEGNPVVEQTAPASGSPESQGSTDPARHPTPIPESQESAMSIDKKLAHKAEAANGAAKKYFG